MMEMLRDQEEALARVCERGHGDTPAVPERVEFILKVANQLKDRLEEAELNSGLRRLKRPFLGVVKDGVTSRELHTQLKVLREVIDGDLGDRWFAVVSPAKGKLIFEERPEVWESVAESFP